MSKSKKTYFPPQHQNIQPGREHLMQPKPVAENPQQVGSFKLLDKVAIITGADSGIGRAVAVAFAKEGADVAVLYLNEHKDAKETARMVDKTGRKCLTFSGDAGDPEFCKKAIMEVVDTMGRVDILVNNAAEQHPRANIENISPQQLEKTFRTNIFSYFYMVQAAMKYLKKGSKIINTTSVTAYRGSPHLLDYSSTKGAIVSFTRSLALNLAKKEIRVNGVAPGPIWTPLIPSTFDKEHVATFGTDVPIGRPGQPEEVAPSFVFLASDDSSYMSGQVLHPNGGEIING